MITDRTRGGAYLSVGITGIAIFGVFLFLTYYLQLVKGYSPVTSGLAFLPMIACILLASNTSSIVLLPKIGPRALITTGMVFGGAGMLYLTQLSATSSYAGGIPRSAPADLLGLGFGMIFAMRPSTHGHREASPARTPGVASALWSTPCSRSAARSAPRH